MADEEKKSKKAPLDSRAGRMARARAAIFKATGQKPLEPTSAGLGFVSTGSFPIDMLIGGTPTKDGKGLICPGLPRRRITEIYGPESSGKTTLLISAMVQAQKAGGTAMFIDFENSLDHNYAKALGLVYDPDQLQVYQPISMEEGFRMMYVGIGLGFDIIGVDSVAAMVPKAEFEKGFEDAAKIGAVAAQFSRVLPKFASWLQKFPLEAGSTDITTAKSDKTHPGTALVFINQTRALIQTGGYGGGGGDAENTSGGKALKFFAYLRLRTSRIKAEMIERVDTMSGKKRRFPYGNVTDVRVIKSKIDAKQGHSTQIFIRYGVGIDDYFSIIETGVVHKIIKKEGAFYSLGDQRFQGRDKFRSYLIAQPRVFEALRTKLAGSVNATAVTVLEPDEDDILLEALDDDVVDVDAAVSEEVITETETSEAS
jgi:recombination protein RecA